MITSDQRGEKRCVMKCMMPLEPLVSLPALKKVASPPRGEKVSPDNTLNMIAHQHFERQLHIG